MPSTARNVTIDFFTGQLDEESETTVAGLFHSIAAGETAGPVSIGAHPYELRDIQKSGRTVRGALAKFRTDDLPHAGRIGGDERELDLKADEGLIEKNHFLYDGHRDVLAFQRNGHASRVGRLGTFLSQIVGETITFNPVVQRDAAARLMRDEVEPLTLELSFARPTNPDVYPSNEWNQKVFELAGQAGAARTRIKLSSDRRSVDELLHSLRDVVKDAAKNFVDTGVASVARVKVLDEGVEYPIDLVADRLVSYQPVEFEGRYPVATSIFGALNDGLHEQQSALDEVLGAPGRRLR